MSLFEDVKKCVVEQLGVEEDKVTESASFVDDLNADSLDLVELVMELEKKFDVKIPQEEQENIKTVADAMKYIEKNKSKLFYRIFFL